MEREKKKEIAKSIIKGLSKNNATIKEVSEICNIVEKMAQSTKVDELCIDSFKDWFD